jgi:hypothetical protein
VHVQPRASRSAVEGLHGDALRVRLTAPPVDGAANDALIQLLAATLAVPRRRVRIVAGEASRSKVIEVEGVSVEAVCALIEPSQRADRKRRSKP